MSAPASAASRSAGPRAGGVAAPARRAQRAAGSALGTHRAQLFTGRSDGVSPADAARGRRDERIRQRRWLWEHSGRERTRDCGRKSRTLGGPAARLSGEGDDARMGMAGLVTCGSMTCPCCASKVGAHRAREISDTLRQHRDDYWHPELKMGGGAVLITLTLRHHVGMALLFLLTVLRYAWGRVTSGGAYQREMTGSGIVGWISSLEITWSRVNGFHPHLHVVVLTDTPVSYEHARDLGERWFLRWERALGRKGVTSVMDSGGLDVRVCDLGDLSTGAIGDYLSKVGREVAGSAAKEGRNGSFSTFGLLREVIATYAADAFGAWEELEATVNGKRVRFLTWSKGAQEIRARAGHAETVTDEEIAATDTGGEDLLVIDPADWPRLRSMLEVFFGVGERDGIVAAALWLTRHRIRYTWCTAAPRLPRPPRPAQRAPRPTRPPGRPRPGGARRV